MSLYIASDHELDLVQSNSDNLQFYTEPVKSEWELDETRRLFQLKYIYYAGSHMGCSCGLYICNSSKEDQETMLSKKDVLLLKNYLQKNVKKNIKLLLTWWDTNEFEYEHKSISLIDPNNYTLEQDVVYTIID